MGSLKKADASICMTFAMVKVALCPQFSPLCSGSHIILSLSECAYPIPPFLLLQLPPSSPLTATFFSFLYSYLTNRKGPCDTALILLRMLVNQPTIVVRPSIFVPFPLSGSFDHHSSAQNKRKVV